jgi:hypothetical protein
MFAATSNIMRSAGALYFGYVLFAINISAPPELAV